MKFKKLISLFLAFFLLVANVGFAINVHYCGGKIVSIKPAYSKTSESINDIEKGCCSPKSSNNVKKKQSCCKDKVVHIQKKSENATIKSLSFQSGFVFLFEVKATKEDYDNLLDCYKYDREEAAK